MKYDMPLLKNTIDTLSGQARLFASGEHAKVVLKIGKVFYEMLRKVHLAQGKQVEALSYAFARCEATANGWVVLLPDDAPYFPFDVDCYDRVSAGNVRLNTHVFKGLLVEFAASDYNCLVNIHDHWFADSAQFSSVDDADDVRFDGYLRSKFEPMLVTQPQLGKAREIHNISLVLSQLGLAARLTHTGKTPVFNSIAQCQLMAEYFQVLGTGEKPLDFKPHARVAAHGLYVRHEAFFTATHQSVIAGLRVALVGCGGLGSILGEALVRSGFKSIVLIDDDVLSTSNLNRWQGAMHSDVGLDKATLLGARLHGMATDVVVNTINRDVFDKACLPYLIGADIIIGGLDNDVARYFLSCVSAQYMVPYFDAGALIVNANKQVDFKGRYFAQLPCVTGCIECKPINLIDKKAVSYSLANASTAASLRHAGYLDSGEPAAAPSAYALNLKISGALMLELLNYCAAWRALATVSSESWRSALVQRCDRENMPEHPVQGCSLCGLRTGMGAVFDLPMPNGEALSVKPMMPVNS